MPELPEVETVRVSLAEKLCGQTIRRAQTFRADLRFPFPENFSARLTGATVSAVYRWSKYLLLELDSGNQFWLIHLGMSGQCRLGTGREKAEKHDHLEVDFSGNIRLHYRDPRRFGFMDLLTAPEHYPALARLGREAIVTSGTYPAAVSDLLDADYLQQCCTGRRTSIKQLLFDQGAIAGLGNIYINEVLWLVGIDPRTSCSAIPGQLFLPLATSITEVLEKALQSGGSSLKDFVDTDGSLGYFQHEWQVYDRTGQSCSKPGCCGQIQRCVQNNRASFFCPEHQVRFELSCAGHDYRKENGER